MLSAESLAEWLSLQTLKRRSRARGHCVVPNSMMSVKTADISLGEVTAVTDITRQGGGMTSGWKGLTSGPKMEGWRTPGAKIGGRRCVMIEIRPLAVIFAARADVRSKIDDVSAHGPVRTSALTSRFADCDIIPLK